jgi:hypothetical protein
VDAHSALAPNWDTLLRLDWLNARNERAVLSTYPYDLDMQPRDIDAQNWQVISAHTPNRLA